MIYYVEDDRGIRDLVVYSLKNTGFDAVGFEDGQAFFKAFKDEKPELVLLDVMLPGEDGLTILKHLRSDAATKTIPVIMVTAKGAEYDKVTGLDLGADDYVEKPFGIMELIARIRAVLRRIAADGEEYSVGGVTLNTRTHRVTAGGSEVVLTLKEFALLALLMKNPDTVLTRDTLLETVWGYDFDGETRTVDVHVRTLRQKLKDKAELIETVRGVGYRIGV